MHRPILPLPNLFEEDKTGTESNPLRGGGELSTTFLLPIQNHHASRISRIKRAARRKKKARFIYHIRNDIDYLSYARGMNKTKTNEFRASVFEDQRSPLVFLVSLITLTTNVPSGKLISRCNRTGVTATVHGASRCERGIHYASELRMHRKCTD